MKPFSSLAFASTLAILHTASASSLRGLVEDDTPTDQPTCKDSGLEWGNCQNYCMPNVTYVDKIENATQWWYDYIVPYIPEEELQYYTEPFGGATQPSLYRSDLVETLLSKENDYQGIRYSHLKGGRDVGSRAPLHRHDFSATTTVIQGYVTLFLQDHAPACYGPGESYYMPPGGLVMSAAIMPRPFCNGELVDQPAQWFSINIDTNASPIGSKITDFVEIEQLEDGSVFDWRNGAWERSNEVPRYARQL